MKRIIGCSKFRLIGNSALSVISLGLFTNGEVLLAQKTVSSGSPNVKSLGAISVQVPKGWLEQTPRSPVRKLEYKLLRASGDSEDGELGVFYFGQGQGGGVEANIQRWISQFTQPNGTSSTNKAKIEKQSVSGLAVTTIDIKGTYQAQAMGLPSHSPAKPGYRMLGAIAETPEGSYFFKLTGPEKTIDRWSESFHQFINSIRKR